MAALDGLNWLNLDHTRVTDEGVAFVGRLSRLTWLHLGSNDLSDQCLPSLARLGTLDHLMLTNCPRITESGRSSLRAALPTTQIQFIK